MVIPRRFHFKKTGTQNFCNDDGDLCILGKPIEQSAETQFIQKGVSHVRNTALDLVRSGHNLLTIEPKDKATEDAQFLYSTQLFNDLFFKSLSSVQVPDAYDNLNQELRNYDKEQLLKDEEFRRAIISISTAWNSLGVYRSDFQKADNDKMARNAFVAEVEMGFLNYIGSVEWDVIDTATGDRVDSAYDFMCQPNPQQSFRDVIVPATRDLFRYDAGAIVKTFNRREELVELHPYLGTEFWIEMDRVPQLISVPTNDNIGIRATEFTSEKTPGKEVLMQGWWSRGYAWRYWQRSQTGVYIPFTPNEVCYLAMYKRSDDVYGIDYLKFLKYWVQYLIDSTVAAGKTFQNGMIPSIIFNHPNIYDINQIQQRITQLRFDNQGPLRTGNAMHLVNGETAETIAQKLVDMEWVDGQRWVAQLIYGYFGFTSDEFIGGDSNRASAYVKRNITKSRLLKPMMRYLEDKINREILPWLPGYKKTWKFRFIQELELDDKQKVAQTSAIRIGSISTALQNGAPLKIALKLANDEPLTKSEIEEWEENRQNTMMQGLDNPEGSEDVMGDNDQGRYGNGSEMYQPVNFSDYGQGGEGTEQRTGNAEEKEYQKSIGEMRYAVGDVFYKAGLKFEIISSNDKIAKARVYLKPGQKAPEGRTVRTGERNKPYYLTQLKQQTSKKKKTGDGRSGSGEDQEDEHSAPSTPEIEGADKIVRVSGAGVGIVAGIVDGKLVAKQVKNKETAAFIRKVIECGGDQDHPGQFLACMKKIAKDDGLEIQA